MKRKSDSIDDLELEKEEIQYYEITSYPTGAGYGGTSYIKLKDKDSSILDSRVTIEILWPNKITTTHKITTTYEHDSHYDSVVQHFIPQQFIHI